MRASCILLVLLLGLHQAAAQEALTCPAQTPPQVIITPHEDPIIYDFNQNRAAMNAMGHDILASQHADANTYVGGLALGITSSKYGIYFQTLTQPGAVPGSGVGCIWLTQVQVMLNYKPTIYISREYTPETCYRRAVLEHEHKHVMTDRQLLQQYIPWLQQVVQTAAQQAGVIGPVAEGELPTIKTNLQTQVGTQLQNAINQISQERERRQAMVDTPQEYARVQAQCSNWP